MGVRKLNKFLTNRGVIKIYRNIHNFVDYLKLDHNNNSRNGKIIIAIDFWLYAHKFLHSTKSENIIRGFYNQIIKFLSVGVIPLYVLDGSVPIEKHEKIEERNRKNNDYKKRIDEIDEEIDKYININELMISENLESLIEKKEKLQKQIKRIKTSELYNIYKLFDLLNIPYIKANFEADALCAKLYKDKIITSCLSDDMDMLALGCGSTIKFQEGQIIEYNLEEIKNVLDVNQEQFIDMCIMFGCDYLQHPVRIECEDVYNLIKKYGSLLNALSSNEHELFNMNNRNVQVIGEHYYQVKDIYLQSSGREEIPNELFDIKMKTINVTELIEFLKKIKWFDTSLKSIRSIEHDIHNINNLIEINNI